MLRPEPGNSTTAEAARGRGFEVLQRPLFEIVALDWAAPDVALYDGLMLTSANAVRWAGESLPAMRSLPVLAVGEATARAAAAAGFDVMMTGFAGAHDLLEHAGETFSRLLHLGGAQTTIVEAGAVARSIAVYAARTLTITLAEAATLAGTTALLHSPRAAKALQKLLARAAIPRAALRIACFSDAVATAAGGGWEGRAVAAHPTDAALLDAASTLFD